MADSRTLVLAVDGLDDRDVATLAGGRLAASHPILATVLAGATTLRVRRGGPSEPVPALASLSTGASVAHTGVPTEAPFRPHPPATPTTSASTTTSAMASASTTASSSGIAPSSPSGPGPSSGPTSAGSAWYAQSLTAPTLFEQARARGLVTAALQWPATAGADIDLCLPLVEDLRHYPNRWEMALRTSSPRMVTEHLQPRREVGLQLSHVPGDALVAEVAAEALTRGHLDLLTVRLTGLGSARRAEGLATAGSRRALLDLAGALQQIVAAFAPGPADRLLLVPGRPLVSTALLVHPNAALADQGLVHTDGALLDSFRALVWPDGPRGALHVRREEDDEVREAALAAMTELAAHSRLQLRRVDDGVGATSETDVLAVLEGSPGTLFGISATHRPLVDPGDPYYAGPRAVTDPSAPTTALGTGPGLPTSAAEGSWADLGVTLAAAVGLQLPGATAAGMCPAALQTSP